jgi:cytochrome P450
LRLTEKSREEVVSCTTLDGLPFLGVLLPLRRDALGFFTRTLRQHGDRVQLRVLGQKVLLLAHPADMEAVLVNDRESYGRSTEVRNLRPIFGDGLLASDGELWRRQRRLIQPKFSHSTMREYANVMIECITAQIAQWQPGEVRDLKLEMMGFTRDVVCQALFGREPSVDAQDIAEAVTVVFGDLRTEILYLPVWRRLPLPRSRRWNRAVGVLNRTIRRMIAERRRSGEAHTDLLGLLISASDEDGSSMSDQQVHDEVLTMFLAGYETSALLLSWAVVLLVIHPEIQEAAAAEVQAVLDNEPLRADHLPELRLVNAIVQETLRLYPAVWSLGRSVVQDTTLGGLSVTRGTHVWLCIYALHHDERWYPEPERFHPQRWLDQATQKRFTFLPFGAGPRMCIGQHFAMTETVLGLAAMLALFRLFPTEEGVPKMEAWVTLRPRGGVRVRLERRRPVHA